MQVSEQQVQAFFRYLEEQRATSESIANFLKRLEGLFANPTAAQWYVLDTNPKTIIPAFTMEYVLLDNTAGTDSAYVYRGNGTSNYPDVIAAAGKRVIARIAKTRTVTISGDVGKVGVFLSAMPLEQYTA